MVISKIICNIIFYKFGKITHIVRFLGFKKKTRETSKIFLKICFTLIYFWSCTCRLVESLIIRKMYKIDLINFIKTTMFENTCPYKKRKEKTIIFQYKTLDVSQLLDLQL